MYAEDYDIGFGFRFDTYQDDFDYDCYGTNEEWDNILCDANSGLYYDYGCVTELM